MTKCAIENCHGEAFKRGWCRRHYLRWYRHGDPRAGRVANGEARAFVLDVAVPFSGDDCLTWPFSRRADGRGQINWNGRPVVASRLVCQLAHGEPPAPNFEAAHSCGRGKHGCVNPRHLSWKTGSANLAERRDHGEVPLGEETHNHKLTAADVQQVRRLWPSMRQKDIAALFGVSRATINDIIAGRTWGHLEVEA